MPKVHVVEQGECLATIARRFDFKNWKTIYDAAENAAFRVKRPNPNVIHPGDEITIPDKRRRDENGATEQRHRFQTKGDSWRFRIEIRDLLQQPLEGMQYRLVLDDGSEVEAETGAKGLIDVPIDAGVKTGHLFIGSETLELRFGHLDPVSRVTGIQARLDNLGYHAGPVDGIVGPKTRRALQRFQADQRIEPADGKVTTETRRRLLRAHDDDERVTDAEEEMAPRAVPAAAPVAKQPASDDAGQPWDDPAPAPASEKKCVTPDTCNPAAAVAQRQLYFAIYYRAREKDDGAFERAARHWWQSVQRRLFFDGASTSIAMHEVTTESDFRVAWQSIADQAVAEKARIVEGAIFSHASLGDREDGLEFGGGGDVTLSRSDIAALPVLPWAASGLFGSGALLVLLSCNSGRTDKRGWSPAEEFAKRQRVAVVGQMGYATFSTEWAQKEQIGEQSQEIYLWAYKGGSNQWYNPANLLSPSSPFFHRIPPAVAFPGSPPGAGMTWDYDFQFGLQMRIAATGD